MLKFLNKKITQMKTKFIYFTFLLFAFSTYINAQILDNRAGFAYAELISKTKTAKKSTTDDLRNVVGTPYANDKFLPGKILYKGEKANTNFLLRYNSNRNLIEVEVEGGGIDNVLMSEKISCQIGNDVYEYTTYINAEENEEETGYIKTLHKSDNYILFSKQKKTFYQEKISVDPLVPSYKAKYVASEKFYLLEKSNNTAYLLKKKRYFLDRVNSSTTKKAMKKYIKKERISFKKEEDLIRLIKHYNTIK
jgi:hypothetical protein